jgi:hypothetical protein
MLVLRLQRLLDDQSRSQPYSRGAAADWRVSIDAGILFDMECLLAGVLACNRAASRILDDVFLPNFAASSGLDLYLA